MSCYQGDAGDMSERNVEHEGQLVLIRLLSVMMSRSRAGTKADNDVSLWDSLTLTRTSIVCNASFFCIQPSCAMVSQETVRVAIQQRGLDFFYTMLERLLAYWKRTPFDEVWAIYIHHF